MRPLRHIFASPLCCLALCGLTSGRTALAQTAPPATVGKIITTAKVIDSAGPKHENVAGINVPAKPFGNFIPYKIITVVKTIDPAGSQYANVVGVTPSGQAFGYYSPANNANIYDFVTGPGGSGYTTISLPQKITFSGFTPSGQVVGTYYAVINGITIGRVGFEISPGGSGFTTIDPAGTLSDPSFASDSSVTISGYTLGGRVFGTYNDPATGQAGVFETGPGGSGYTTVAPPAGFSSMGIVGITPSGRLFGTYRDPATGQGYGFVTGPGGSGYTTVGSAAYSNLTIVGASDSGQVFGTYRDPETGNVDSFETGPSGSGFTPIVAPAGSLNLTVTGVTPIGQAFGYYFDSRGSQCGFETGPGGSGFTSIIAYDPYGLNDVIVSGVNPTGQAFGYYYSQLLGSFDYLAFVTGPGGSDFITIYPPNSSHVKVVGIDDSGQVYGNYQDLTSRNGYGFVASLGLSVTGTASSNPVSAGEPLTYSFTVTNNSSTTATGVTLTDTLPSDAIIQSGNATVSLGNLTGGSSATVTIVVKETKEGQHTDSATVSGQIGSSAATASTQITNLVSLVQQVKLGLPAYDVTGSNLLVPLWVQGNGSGTFSGQWLYNGQPLKPITDQHVDLTSGGWVQACQVQIPFQSAAQAQAVGNWTLLADINDMPTDLRTGTVKAEVTNFRPAGNGWIFNNSGPSFPNYRFFTNNNKFDGYCLGMCRTALGYFDDGTPIPQGLTATPDEELQISASESTGNLLANIDKARLFLEGLLPYPPSNEAEADRTENDLATHQPQILGLLSTNSQHPVVAVGCFDVSGVYDSAFPDYHLNEKRFSLYDPNIPNIYLHLDVGDPGLGSIVQYNNGSNIYNEIFEYTGPSTPPPPLIVGNARR